MFRTTCGLVLAGLFLAGCDDPAMHPPKASVAIAPAWPTAAALTSLRGALGSCESAMDGAADSIGQLAANGRAAAQGRPVIEQARLICDGATAEIRSLPLWGRLKDPCAQAAHARQAVATGALDVLDGRATAVGVPALRDKIADQTSLSRACAGEIALAERQAAPG